MRIELNTPDLQSLSTETAKKTSALSNPIDAQADGDPTSPYGDKVTLSALSTQALNQPEIRPSLVDSLREAINNGQYRPEPGAIADAILNR